MFKTTGMFESLSYIGMGDNGIVVPKVTILRHMPILQTLVLYINKLTYIDEFRIYYKNTIRLIYNPCIVVRLYPGWTRTTWRLRMAWFVKLRPVCTESPLLTWVNISSGKIYTSYNFQSNKPIFSDDQWWLCNIRCSREMLLLIIPWEIWMRF